MAKKDEERQLRLKSKKKKQIMTIIAAIIVVVAVVIALVVLNRSKNGKASCKVNNYKGLELTKFDTTVTDKDYEVFFESMLANTANYVADDSKAKDAAKDKDIVSIDFDGKIDGKDLDSGEDFIVNIGSGDMIEGFEAGIIGMKIGETKDVEATFPAYYQPDPNLSGKKAVFTIKLNYIAKEVKEITDAYIARQTKGVYKTKQDYIDKYLKEYLTNSKNAYGESFLENQTVSVLMENSTFKNADKDIEDYYNTLLKQYESYAKQSNMNLEQYVKYFGGDSLDEFKESLHTKCEMGVKQSLMMDYIAKKEKLEMTDEIYKKYVDKVIEENNAGSEENLKNNFSEARIKQMILQCYALDVVYSYATFKDAK